jgi:hypothetical protein
MPVTGGASSARRGLFFLVLDSQRSIFNIQLERRAVQSSPQGDSEILLDAPIQYIVELAAVRICHGAPNGMVPAE